MENSSTETIVKRANEETFGFAFNDSDFSDRVLRLEIVPDDESIDSSKNLRGGKYHEWSSSINVDHCKHSKSCDGAKVVTLHISSVLLAAKSPFFYKLFKNGMRESQHKNDVSLKISASEEATLMDLLNYMYGNKVSAISVTDLVDLLVAADKFEVTTCMRYSIQILLKLPMSLEDAIRYLELPSGVLVSEIVQPLINEAKNYVFGRFKDLTKSKDEAMELPISVLEVVLGSEGILVDSEDDVYDFVMSWACEKYPEPEERQDILMNHLARFLCLSNMSSPKLKEVLVCPDFEHEQVSKLVMEALFSKVESSCGQHIHSITNCPCSRRVYNPCFVVHTDRCVVYFDLKKSDCASDVFQQNGLGLYLCKEKGSGTCTVDFEFEVKTKSSKEFQSKAKVNNHMLGEGGWGYEDLLGIPWTELMSDNSDYFIDGMSSSS